MAPAHPDEDRDERVHLPLDPEDAVRALLAVDPADEGDQGDEDKGIA